MNNRTPAAAALAGALALTLAGCGSSGDQPAAAPATTITVAAPAVTTTATATVKVPGPAATTVQVTRTVTAPPPPPVAAIEEGVWTVGSDIKPGTYRTIDAVTDGCYWSITKSGSNGSDIINNGTPTGGHPVVTLRKGQDFETHDCGSWAKR
ncbi:hypothetical protein [Terrabacter terrigena]|uniref:Lipoprotein n=1 Tax=Terrabacter terrigena TaxID=574718 RepID=A0ABW3MZ98_9MICO